MGIDRIVYIIAAIFGLDYRICTPTRDMQAEGALTRALARNGGDGLTACNPDAGVCPKPCLRHRRANVGIWPNWRTVAWRKSMHMLDVCPSRHEYENDQCQDFDAQAAQLFAMAQQARNISDNMGISSLWDREPDRKFGGATVIHELANEPNPAHEIDTTWYAQYPEQVWNERSEPQWTVTSLAPRSFEGRTYRFDPISITVLLPAESPQPSSSLPPSLDASLPQPSPDSAT